MDMTDVRATIEREFACDCAEKQLCFKICSNGVRQYVHQCHRCGSQSGAIRQTTLSMQAMANAVEFIPDLSNEWYEQKRHRQIELQKLVIDSKNAAWWAQYTEYLKSEKWLRKRDAVLKRDNYICQACLHRQANQAHHLTYDHVFDEPLFDLISVCVTCHKKITDMDRAARNATA